MCQVVALDNACRVSAPATPAFLKLNTGALEPRRPLMATPNDPGRSNRMVLTVVVILGIVLLVVGWYTWFRG
jgi:hypothetical protein